MVELFQRFKVNETTIYIRLRENKLYQECLPRRQSVTSESDCRIMLKFHDKFCPLILMQIFTVISRIIVQRDLKSIWTFQVSSNVTRIETGNIIIPCYSRTCWRSYSRVPFILLMNKCLVVTWKTFLKCTFLEGDAHLQNLSGFRIPVQVVKTCTDKIIETL